MTTPVTDRYPDDTSIPAGYLVAPELQPHYLDVPGVSLGDTANIGDHLADAHVRAGRGDTLALIQHETGRQWTYAEVAEVSGRVAAALLRHGLRVGDRVAVRARNRPEAVIAAIAIWKAGGVVIPTPFRATGPELAFLLDDTEAGFLIADTAQGADLGPVEAARSTRPLQVVAMDDTVPEGWLSWHGALREERATPRPTRSADHVAVLWHTGGTTGRPKSCYHTHRRYLLAGFSTAHAIGVRHGERWTASAPVGHALGLLLHTSFTLLHGATVVMAERFQDPAVIIEAIDRHAVGVYTGMLIGWSRMLGILNDAGGQLPSLRRGFAMWQTSASSKTRDGWRARGVELLNNFGSTSFAAWPLVARAGEAEPGSLGRPAPGYLAVAADPGASGVHPVADGQPGQLAVRGPSGLTYWRRPELQRRDVRDGWNLQDDLIRWEKSGNASYLGRTDFLISTSGFKVTPAEVEEVLIRHPAIQEACVVGIPDPERGEVVAAGIVLAPGCEARAGLEGEIRKYCKTELSSYKAPRRVLVLPSLPRDHVGKIQPRRMREMLDAARQTGAGR